MQIILASQSPRRQELLARMGLAFDVRVADIDESMDPRANPAEEVQRVAARKAAAIARISPQGAVIVAADTIVLLDNQILGKPKDANDAHRTLCALSGREHHVLTGLVVQSGDHVQIDVVDTRVSFRPLSQAEIAAYVATGDPLDKAGSYGVQGLGAVFVSALAGDYYNVMGLPLCRLCEMLRAAGVVVLA